MAAPARFTIDGVAQQRSESDGGLGRVELKSDGFGRVERVQTETGPVLVRVPCGGRFPGSAWVARYLARRERRALEHLAGVPELAGRVPRLLAIPGLDGAREFLVGEPLWRATQLPRDYFERLEELVREVHRAGVCHNDLHKEPNLLVLADGRPALIDFQLASIHRGGRRFRVRQAEDLRHVDKHRRRYARRGAPKTDRDRAGRAKRSGLAAVWRRLGKPVYDGVVHGLLARPSSEPRRPEIGPWPNWGPALCAPDSAPARSEGNSPATPGPKD